MSTFTVIDKINDEVVLESATRDEVQEYLHIGDTTFYNCISEQRLCRRKFRILPEYGEKTSADLPPNFAERWQNMQRLFGITQEGEE